MRADEVRVGGSITNNSRGKIIASLTSVAIAVPMAWAVFDSGMAKYHPGFGRILWIMLLLLPYAFVAAVVPCVVLGDSRSWPRFIEKNALIIVTIVEIVAFIATSLLVGGVAVI